MHGIADAAEAAVDPRKGQLAEGCRRLWPELNSQTQHLVARTQSHLRAAEGTWRKSSLHSNQLSLNAAAVNSFTLLISFLPTS